MKKNYVISSTVALLMLFFSISAAQDSTISKTSVKWGLGVTTTLFTLNSYQSYVPQYQNTAISIPIFLSGQFKIEPYIAYVHYNNEEEVYEINYHSLIIATGILYSQDFVDTRLHFGVNIGYINNNFKYKDTYDYSPYSSEDNGNGFLIAPTIGGEYFFSGHFSLGSEIRLEFSKIDSDNNDTDYILVDNYDSSTKRFATMAMIMVRIYFK
jgi:hypothetical protein